MIIFHREPCVREPQAKYQKSGQRHAPLFLIFKRVQKQCPSTSGLCQHRDEDILYTMRFPPPPLCLLFSSWHENQYDRIGQQYDPNWASRMTDQLHSFSRSN